MRQYVNLVRHILGYGTRKKNRTGVDTISTFNYNFEHDLWDGFPLLTTKAISWKNIVIEMLWFLSGRTDIEILKRHGCNFWDPWADENGEVPSAYGHFWRHFPVHGEVPGHLAFNDQIAWVLGELMQNPMSRRMVVSAWAPGNAQTSKLPPCHTLFVLNVQNEYLYDDEASSETEPPVQKRLCLHLTQRSCDTALGVPYNIASYALLLSIFAHLSGIEPGIFAYTLVDAHIYTAKPDGSMAEYDHIPGLKEQIVRELRSLPRLTIDPSIKSLGDIEKLMSPSVTTDTIMQKFRLDGYNPHPPIPFRVAVLAFSSYFKTGNTLRPQAFLVGTERNGTACGAHERTS